MPPSRYKLHLCSVVNIKVPTTASIVKAYGTVLLTHDNIEGSKYTKRLNKQMLGCSHEATKNIRHPHLQQAAAEDDPISSGSDEAVTLEKKRQAAATAAARGKQLNLACNDVVRTILDGNVINEKERALALRLRLEEQKEGLVSPDDDMSALFFDNLLLVCQHELHPDVGRLRGEYGKAWRTILHYVEDAGWQLTDPPFSISG